MDGKIQAKVGLHHAPVPRSSILNASTSKTHPEELAPRQRRCGASDYIWYEKREIKLNYCSEGRTRTAAANR